MLSITSAYLQRAENWLLITTLAYFLLNGAQLFETAVLVPKWTAKPPASFVVLQGPYGPDLKTFWVIAHCIHELTFIAAIVFCWQIQALRLGLLVIFGIHFAVRVWTLVYFAPNIMAFQKADTDKGYARLQKDTSNWKQLNYLRVALFVALSLAVGILYLKLRDLNLNTTATNKNQIMEQRVSVITIGVDDLATQKEFYKTKLGWKSVAENKDIVFFKLNGVLFSLLDRKALAASSGVDSNGTGFRSVTISQNLPGKEAVDKMYQQFKAQGITILKPPTSTPFGGYYFIFADPEHNVLEVAYNPYIALDANGDVITHENIDNL